MKKLFLSVGLLIATTAISAIVEIGAGYGVMSYDLVDRGQSKYVFKDNTYSGGFSKVYAHANFSINKIKIGLGGFAAFPAFTNNVIVPTSTIGISFPWNRFGLDSKIGTSWLPWISPYIRSALGYESWKVNGSYSGVGFEYGNFGGIYAELGIGLDFTIVSILHLFVEGGVAVGYQTGRFMDPKASTAANNFVYYDTSTRTRGVYALIGMSVNF